MKVMLKENIESLGKKGEILNVAAGYGRNYLIPKKLAIKVTPSNIRMIAIEQKALQKGLEKEMASYQALVEKLNQVSLTFSRKTGEKDVLFGSVSSSDIREALEGQGFELEKKKILLDEPIKRLGNYSIPIKVFHEEKAEIKVAVVSEEEKKEKTAEVHAEAEGEQISGKEPEQEEAPEIESEEEQKALSNEIKEDKEDS
ncbi:MAG: 50S ribosomal protein L9 [Candidatus Aminicenantes bacterium]|nr:50S ribosomal protein L9 [Candidatus Aminicenantes bacterium]